MVPWTHQEWSQKAELGVSPKHHQKKEKKRKERTQKQGKKETLAFLLFVVISGRETGLCLSSKNSTKRFWKKFNNFLHFFSCLIMGLNVNRFFLYFSFQTYDCVLCWAFSSRDLYWMATGNPHRGLENISRLILCECVYKCGPLCTYLKKKKLLAQQSHLYRSPRTRKQI